MNHRGAEAQRGDELTSDVIGAAIEVHRELGSGLLESAYEEYLFQELNWRDLLFERQVDVPAAYKGVRLDCGYRADLIVDSAVLLELETVDQLAPNHEGQILTYLRLLEV